MHPCTGNLKKSRKILENPLVDKKLPNVGVHFTALSLLWASQYALTAWFCVRSISQVLNNSSKIELSLTQQNHSLGVDPL